MRRRGRGSWRREEGEEEKAWIADVFRCAGVLSDGSTDGCAGVFWNVSSGLALFLRRSSPPVSGPGASLGWLGCFAGGCGLWSMALFSWGVSLRAECPEIPCGVVAAVLFCWSVAAVLFRWCVCVVESTCGVFVPAGGMQSCSARAGLSAVLLAEVLVEEELLERRQRIVSGGLAVPLA